MSVAVAYLECSAVQLLLVCVVGWYVLQYICERCGSVLGMFCSTVITGVVVGWYVLQYICEQCACYFLQYSCEWYALYVLQYTRKRYGGELVCSEVQL